MLARTLATIAMATLVGACAGGGQSDLAEAPPYTPTAFTPNTIIVSDIVVRGEGVDIRVPVESEAGVCRYAFAGESGMVGIADVIEIDSEGSAPEVSERLYGIGLSEESTDEFFFEDIGATFLGAWMESSAFLAASVEVADDEIGDTALAFAVALGDSPGTNPVARGGGTWTGAMVGSDTHASEIVKGRATIRIRDFSDPSADVAFTRVRAASGPRNDMTWTGLSIENGTFANSSIQGTFFGERHTEVAGTFERDRVIGAFGARRP